MDTVKTFSEAFATDNQDIAKGVKDAFKGWHYATQQGPCRTAFAAITKTLGEYVHIADNEEAFLNVYARILHNNGMTLQTRHEAMVLTRPVRVLVRGPSPVCEPTVCIPQDYIVFTDAHIVAENHAICTLIDEAKRQVLVGAGNAHAVVIKHENALRKKPAVTNFNVLVNECVPAASIALLVQSTAVLITGYGDSGRNFRDRASRHEAARHVGEAVRAILACAVS
jgi:hypothetical protein